MSYRLIIHPQYEEELREQALDYQDQFSSGINDFIDAIKDTYQRILPFPYSHPMVEDLGDKNVRGIRIHADSKRGNFASNFPFKLIYKIYPDKGEIVIYQLWPERSNRRIDKLE